MSPKWDDDYEPYEHRNLGHGLTHWESLVNVFKSCVGTGVLALPEAFYYAGMVNAIVLYLIIYVFGTYCFHLLLRSMYQLCKIRKVGFLSYGESVEAAFEVGPQCLQHLSKYAARGIDITFIVYQMAALCIYLIFMSVNTKMVCDVYIHEIPLYVYFILILIPSIAIVLIPNIKVLTPYTAFANLITVFTLGTIAYYVRNDLPPFSSRPYMGEWKNLPLFFGTAFFALLAVPMVVTVENNTADPKWFRSTFGALNLGFTFVIILYITVGVMGYWKYGSQIESSITLNFPPEEWLGQVVRILYSFSICVNFALNLLVPRDIILDTYVQPRLEANEASIRKQCCADYAVRLGIVLICFIAALCVPFLGLVISLFGGVVLSLLGIILPGLMEICILWPNEFGKLNYILFKDMLIMLIGILIMSSCLYASIRDIVFKLEKNDPTFFNSSKLRSTKEAMPTNTHAHKFYALDVSASNQSMCEALHSCLNRTLWRGDTNVGRILLRQTSYFDTQKCINFHSYMW